MSKYQGRVDPLQLLRSAYTEGKRVKLKDKQLVFDKDIRLPLTHPTAWLSTLTKKQYTLGSLWLYLELHLQHITDYLNKISEYGVDNVTISDREQIANYFLGKVADSKCINQELKLELSMKNYPKRDQPLSGFEEGGDPTKKPKPEFKLPFELQVIDFITKFQRPTSSKTRSLRCPNKSFESLLKILQTNSGDQPSKVQDKKMRINAILQRKKFPIIIVPEHAQTGNLSLGNVQKFLVDGEYIESSTVNSHQRKIELEYTLRGKKTTFDVTNNPSLLSLSDWQNVVAVFVQGRKNEFQGWAVKDAVEIFKRAKGFLLKFPTKDQSQGTQWNIKVFNLDRNVRYRDSNIQKAIWGQIQNFLYQKV